MRAKDVVRIDYPNVKYGAAFIEIYNGTEWKILFKCGKNVAREKAKLLCEALVYVSQQSMNGKVEVEQSVVVEHPSHGAYFYDKC